MLAVLAVAAPGASALPAQRLLADTTPGTAPTSSSPTLFVSDGVRAFFRASTPAAGSELWVTDGTSGGTRLVADLQPADLGSVPYPAVTVNGRLLFTATTAGLGLEPWSTDGTAAGTFLLADLDPSNLAVDITGFGATNGRAIFRHSTGARLFAADLAVPGATLLMQGATDHSGITHLGLVWFTAGSQLWVTDGTPAGTLAIASGPLHGQQPGATHMFWFVPMGGAYTAWRSDGTVAGTVPIGTAPVPLLACVARAGQGIVFVGSGSLWYCDAITPPAVLAPMPPNHVLASSGVFGTLGNRALIQVQSTVTFAHALLSTDGTAAGTHLLTLPGAEQPVYFAAVGALGYFTRAGGPGSLWRTDGTPGLLQQVTTLPSHAPGLATCNGRILLPLSTPAIGQELFAFDPAGGLGLLRNIAGDERGISAWPTAAVGDRMFFFATPPAPLHVWVSDGTPAGTFDVSAAGPGATSWPPPEIAAYEGRAIFRTSGAGTGLQATAGTAAATQPFAPFLGSSEPRQVRAIDGLLWWLDGQQRRVHASDGTIAGSRFLQLTGAPWNYEWHDGLLFVAGDPTGIVRSDFTAAGTWLIDPAPNVAQELLGRVGSRVVYLTAGTSLRSSDGSPGGVQQLLQLSNYYLRVTEWDGRLWLRELGGNPSRLFRTDGTPAGSALADLLPPPNAVLGDLQPAHDGMYFVGADAAEGAELWRCTGQPGGTARAVSLFPGPGSGVRAIWPLGTGHRLMLAGGDASTGCELFVSDGTPAGTTLVADLVPGPGSSNPEFLGIAGRHLFLLANHPVAGREPWVVDLATLGVANVQALWGGGGGTAGRPRLATSAPPRVGEAGFGFQVTNVPPFSPVVLAKSTTNAPAPMAGCTVFPGGAFVSLLAVAGTTGAAAFAIPVPAAPSLIGFTFVAQAGALDALGVCAGFAVTDALAIQIGA